jgi:hypothetical protein
VQNQLEQMGVNEASVRRALEQLSQEAKVCLQQLTLEEIRMYTQWYFFHLIFILIYIGTFLELG